MLFCGYVPVGVSDYLTNWPWTRIAWLSLCLAMLVPDFSFAQTQVQTPVVWNFLGPSGPSGPRTRVLSLAVDPRNDSVVYAATPGGGLWKTQDGGGTWFPQLKGASSLQVCSVAVDPRSSDVVYVGTGDDQIPGPVRAWHAPSMADKAGISDPILPINRSAPSRWILRTRRACLQALGKDCLFLRTLRPVGRRFYRVLSLRLRLMGEAVSTPECLATIG